MRHLLSNSQALHLDSASCELGLPSLSLMEQAGLLMYQTLLELWQPQPTSQALVLVGTGNNGGDGLVLARLALLEKRFRVQVLLWGEAKTPECQLQLRLFKALGGDWIPWEDERAEAWLSGADLWVDALLGVGWKAPLRSLSVERLHRLETLRLKHHPLVATIDVPSGLTENSEQDSESSILSATWTLAAGFGKISCFQPHLRQKAGQVIPVSVAFPASLPSESVWWLEEQDLPNLGGQIPADSWKNQRGHVAVAAGSPTYWGAGLLACRSAQAAGAGLVTWVTNLEKTLPASLMRRSEEDLTQISCSAWVVGPGWGRAPEREALLHELWQTSVPLVIDADGLYALASLLRQKQLSPRKNTVLTPHPGELARLKASLVLEESGLGFEEVLMAMAKATGAVIVAKNSVTWIVSPEGAKAVWDGREPALATGGSGDCLAGFLGAYLARGRSAWEAACAAVILQGTSGKELASRKGWFSADDLWKQAARVASCAAQAYSSRLKRG